MPPLHIFVLALIGGYLFCTQCALTKYRVLRSEGYRLVFESILYGAALLFLGTFIVSFVQSRSVGPTLTKCWHDLVPIPHSGKAVTALLLGLLGCRLLNRLGGFWDYLSERAAADRAIRERGDPLEIFFRAAFGSGETIAVTLKSGKVYVGVLKQMPPPLPPRESLVLFPRWSGYREKETHRLYLPTDYEETHKQILNTFQEQYLEELALALDQHPDASDEELKRLAGKKLSDAAIIEHFKVVVPWGEIHTVSTFSREVYDSHFQSEQEKKETLADAI